MNKNNLEQQLKKELLKDDFNSRIVKPALIFIFIALGLLALYFIAPTPSEHQVEIINGKTLRQIPASESYGYKFAMIVQLKNGSEARVPIKKDTKFKKQRSVEIKKITSTGGTISYEFNRYKN